MAMGHDDSEQPTLFLTYDNLRGLGHPFYDALDRLLREQGFDRYMEGLCEPHYAEVMGRPGLAPGDALGPGVLVPPALALMLLTPVTIAAGAWSVRKMET